MPDDVLLELRRRLHSLPELSGGEAATSALIRDFLKGHQPDRMVEDLGGHGLAAIFRGEKEGPTVLLRCELDAVPVWESDRPHQSTADGVAHACGHDGHMAILCGMARQLAQRRPESGRVVLLFQPAEETGAGAAAVSADPRFADIRPDWAFALHNLPGYPFGQIVMKSGPMACASQGLMAMLGGKPAHAAWPETGCSPALALGRIVTALDAENHVDSEEGFAQATIVHARLGEEVFGTTPAEGVVMATLRSDSEAGMEALVARAREIVQREAEASGLTWAIEWRDIFPATINDKDACDHLQGAAREADVACRILEEPMRASEDFGHFTSLTPGVLFGLGSGENHPALHTRTYDFPDDLLDVGLRLWRALIDRLLNDRQ